MGGVAQLIQRHLAIREAARLVVGDVAVLAPAAVSQVDLVLVDLFAHGLHRGGGEEEALLLRHRQFRTNHVVEVLFHEGAEIVEGRPCGAAAPASPGTRPCGRPRVFQGDVSRVDDLAKGLIPAVRPAGDDRAEDAALAVGALDLLRQLFRHYAAHFRGILYDCAGEPCAPDALPTPPRELCTH